MSKRTMPIVALAAALAVAAPVAYASVSSQARPAVTSFTLYSHQSKLSLVDVDGNRKPSPGDLAISTYIDYDHQGGQVIGTGTAVCTVVRLSSLLLECTSSDALRDGDLFEACTQTTSLVCTVTGGTGAYRFSHGEALAKADRHGKNLLTTFTLTGA